MRNSTKFHQAKACVEDMVRNPIAGLSTSYWEDRVQGRAIFRAACAADEAAQAYWQGDYPCLRGGREVWLGAFRRAYRWNPLRSKLYRTAFAKLHAAERRSTD